MQRQTSTNQRDAPGQDTGRSQGLLSSYLLGGAPGERHRARCKSHSRGCDTHCRGLDERPMQNLRSTGQENPQGDSRQPRTDRECDMTRNQLVEKKPDGKEPRNTHHRGHSGDRSRPADVRTHEERSSTDRASRETKTAGGQQTGMIGKDTHGHTLTHRAPRRETDAHKTRA
jgi:hypothetical protein